MTVIKQRFARRLGLTTLEFVGCFTALVSGAWLGALYLGVDVKGVAYTTLSESQLLEKVPQRWRPQPPQDKTIAREQLVSTLREELGSLRAEITALQAGKGSGSVGTPELHGADSTAPHATKVQTLAYWSRLNEIALGEAALEQDAEAAFDAENAAKVFAIKGRISRFAAKSVEAVPTVAVDETAVRFGRQLAQWYEHGGELYEQAVQIWETPGGTQAQTKFNDEWKQANEHHQNEARLLHERAAAVRSSVSRVYGEDFPEFAKPAKPAANAATKATAAT